jgi:hypothetical protein
MTNSARQRVWPSPPARRPAPATPLERSIFVVTSGAILLLGVLDALTTYIGRELGVSQEKNPVTSELIAIVGFVPALVLRVAIGAIIVIGLRCVAFTFARLPAVAIGVGLGTVAWWTFVVTRNVQVLASRV